MADMWEKETETAGGQFASGGDATPSGVENELSFMLELMKENLNQARHVENERMMFVTLFAALVGGVLAVVSQMSDKLVSCVLIGLLLLLNLLCIVFVKRWNRVFSGHVQTAKRLYLELCDPKNVRRMDNSQLSMHPLINRYYLFDNRLNAKKQLVYIRTAQLFDWYNYALFAVLVFCFFYFLGVT